MFRLARARRIGSILAAPAASVAAQNRFIINNPVPQTWGERCLFPKLMSLFHFLQFQSNWGVLSQISIFSFPVFIIINGSFICFIFRAAAQRLAHADPHRDTLSPQKVLCRDFCSRVLVNLVNRWETGTVQGARVHAGPISSQMRDAWRPVCE